MEHIHTYRTQLSWSGSTAGGYDDYDRTHRLALPPNAGTLLTTADPAFRGSDELTNPEQMLVAAASSCQLLSYLAMAARSRIDVRSYEDSAEAIMPEDDRPVRITRITLRPRIVIAAGGDVDRALRLVERAHHECYIANSLTSEIVIEPTVEVA